MNPPLSHITVCVCTLQRPALLLNLLEHLAQQETEDWFTYSVVVSDNDPAESARPVLTQLPPNLAAQVRYVVEPRRSISHARNRSLEPAQGDYIAFIDDDEFPPRTWLLTMYRALAKAGSSGVFGPVLPSYEPGTPDWVRKAGFYERPNHPTGFIMPWKECRTGNVLIRRAVLDGLDPVFRPEFGGGASDQDLFRRLMELGHKFTWCSEGWVHEVVPPGRCQRRFLLRRALLRGSLTARHPEGRALNAAKSALAVPLYACALPFLQLFGHHRFMRYLVKLCDHAGRLLALLGINPVSVRDMQ